MSYEICWTSVRHKGIKLGVKSLNTMLEYSPKTLTLVQYYEIVGILITMTENKVIFLQMFT